MPPRRNTKSNPKVTPTTKPTIGQTRRGRPSRNPVVIPLTETPTSSTPIPLPPKSGLPQTTTKLEQLVSEHVTIAIATARSLNVGRQVVEVNGLGNKVGSTLQLHPEVPRRTCSYKDFMNCKPRNFYGNECVVGLSRWFEKVEVVFDICYCSEGSNVCFVAWTLIDGALTWWTDHVKTFGVSVANSMSWENMKELLIEEYFPREEEQRLEIELWYLKMKGYDVKPYTRRFNDLSLLYPGIVKPECKKVNRYIWGLASQIKGMVLSSKPTTYLSAKRLAMQLIKYEIENGVMVEKIETPKVNNNNHKHKSNGANRNH
uniref:Retrotransposon gag domain-containing protein n=1 Tax=Lactuca sativa TaxID=4236 RepID=A0A9R1UQU5_LACSA|nr:hypothetical protein LSAT_V11C800446920 [Lactuca sativa]